jgi:hypothetical protein
MDYGGCDRRKTKKELRRKGIAGRYKRGGQFRTLEIKTSSDGEQNKSSKRK